MSGRQRSGDLLLIVLDENIASEDLQDALTPVALAAGARVDLHTTHFPRETKDLVWMPIAAERHWAVISCDVSVKRRPAEKEILMNAGVCMYILRGTLNGDQIRDALVKALPTICRRHRASAARSTGDLPHFSEWRGHRENRRAAWWDQAPVAPVQRAESSATPSSRAAWRAGGAVWRSGEGRERRMMASGECCAIFAGTDRRSHAKTAAAYQGRRLLGCARPSPHHHLPGR